MAGRLVFVVGPSGAGKDSIMAGARARLEGDDRFVFPRRVITRPPETDGEDHEPIDQAAFSARQAAGAFALAWSAHGLSYGIPATMEDDLAMGRTVVVNVSRAVIDRARQSYPGLLVIVVTAPRDVVRARLLARGREDVFGIEARVSRADAFSVAGPDVVVVNNDGPLADAVDAFVRRVQPASA